MEKKKIGTILLVVFGIVMLVVIIIIATSIQSVPMNYVAIKQHKFNKKIDTENIYKNGRYFVGPVSK
jgi:hypothetical protein